MCAAIPITQSRATPHSITGGGEASWGTDATNHHPVRLQAQHTPSQTHPIAASCNVCPCDSDLVRTLTAGTGARARTYAQASRPLHHRRHAQYNQQSAFKRSNEMHCSRLQLQVRARRRSGQAPFGPSPRAGTARITSAPSSPLYTIAVANVAKSRTPKGQIHVLLKLEPSTIGRNWPQIERVNENSALQVSAS